MAGNRIRCVRPELLEHPRFAAMSDGAVRLWLGLFPCWDDEGRSLGSVGYVAGRVYFARTKGKTMIGRELAELEGNSWLIRYEVGGVEYLAVRGWDDPNSPTYQYIKAPRRSKFPAPPSIPWAKPDAKPGATEQEQEEEQEQEQEWTARSPMGRGRAPRGDHAQAIAAFHDRFVARYSTAPTWGPKQAGMIKLLLKQHPLAEVERRIAILFDAPPVFLRNSPPDVGTLVQHFDKLAAPTTSPNGQRGPQYVTAASLKDEIAADEERERRDREGGA